MYKIVNLDYDDVFEELHENLNRFYNECLDDDYKVLATEKAFEAFYLLRGFYSSNCCQPFDITIDSKRVRDFPNTLQKPNI